MNAIIKKMQILKESHGEILTKVKTLLLDYLKFPSDDDQLEKQLVQDLLIQLDDLILIVVSGEYNSGKSAFINALLGDNFLTTGATPTTEDITILRHGERKEIKRVSAGEMVIHLPVPLLKAVTIVDTPGTNAIQRKHERLTADFIPRADLVLFVTSVDRPFTESERIFIEAIRSWGKKIVILINKVDILDSPDDADEVMQFVKGHAKNLLEIEPKIFFTSAKEALKHKQKFGQADKDFSIIESFIQNTLNPKEQIPIKLANPLGVLDALIDKRITLSKEKLDLLNHDIQLLNDIEDQINLFREDMRRDFKFRYSSIDNILLEFEKRGLRFFDDTLRFGRIMDLINKEKIQNEYNQQVVSGLSKEIDKKVDELVDWLVAEDLKQWQVITYRIDQRIMKYQDRILDNPATRQIQFERQKVIDAVRRESQRIVELFDKEEESRKIAEDAQIAVAASAAVEVGAIGLGTLVTLLATTASADLTGILLAGVTATLGFFIIPTKKKRMRTLFSKNISDLRKKLSDSLSKEFDMQVNLVIDRIRETVQPYNRFVRYEQNLLENDLAKCSEFKNRIAILKNEIANL